MPRPSPLSLDDTPVGTDDDDAPLQQQQQQPHERLAPCRVSRWSLAEVQDHIFFAVWVCGVPVHVRYVAHILAHSAVATAVDLSDTVSLVALAQHAVLAPVHRRAQQLRNTLASWPAAAAEALSEVVLLGVRDSAEVEAATPAGPSPPPPPAPRTTVVRAGVVVPDECFANVTAVALCAPAERETATEACARAYWTAAAQAQRWIAGWPSRADGPESVGIWCTEASAAAPLRPAATTAAPGRQHQRGGGGGVPVADEVVVVVVDADEATQRHGSSGGAHRVSASCGDAPAAKARRLEAAADVVVFVVDSDEDEAV
ncbi:hypothetical protein NESM_000684500 [Novymonas esmeraldas]|uniref:Uncharacterized protein n=1 Tax=Novymonas esmeraldas TaxID=1808958 RepID=A0AAW0EUZ0_9TRYP